MVTLAELKTYLGKSHTTKNDDVYTDMLNTAIQKVIDYVGYDPAVTLYEDHFLDGPGDMYLLLPARPITTVTELLIGESNIDLSKIKIKDSYIYYECGFPAGVNNIQITFTAGYTSIPETFKTTVLRVADILLKQRTNLGYSGYNSEISGSQNFNDKNPDWYLRTLHRYRIIPC